MIFLSDHSRRKALIRLAREEFITPGVMINISEAARRYWKAHPKECAGVALTITTREADRPRTILDDYERPKCRKCGAPMFWKSGCGECKGPVKKNQWTCKECGFKRFTKDTLEKAIAKLERRG